MDRRGGKKTGGGGEYFRVLGRSYRIPLTLEGGGTKERILYEATLLFAKCGYAAVSMKDIANATGVKPASIYNHFAGKDELWKAVLDHAIGLYLLYFEHLEEEMNKARSFAEILGLVFTEPRKMDNLFTCYAFSLLQTEQFRDRIAGTKLNEVFLKYSIDFFEKRFQECVAGRLAAPFDCRAVATLIMNSVLMAINVKVHECLGRKAPYDPAEMLGSLHRLLIRLLSSEPGASASPPEPAGYADSRD